MRHDRAIVDALEPRALLSVSLTLGAEVSFESDFNAYAVELDAEAYLGRSRGDTRGDNDDFATFSVAFYHDDGDGRYTDADALLGVDRTYDDGGSGWRWKEPVSSFQLGERHTFFAVATLGGEPMSNVASATLVINSDGTGGSNDSSRGDRDGRRGGGGNGPSDDDGTPDRGRGDRGNDGGSTDDDGTPDQGRGDRSRTDRSGGDAFVARFRAIAPSGAFAGSGAVAELSSLVSESIYSTGYWGAENHWFQDSSGGVWALWHGGPVHALRDGSGEHSWRLTSLSDAAGLTDVGFTPGSMSGITTGWNAFSVQGVDGTGELVSLWWSPGSGASGMGINANGWVLSSLSEALIDTRTDTSASTISFTPRTYSQGNGRATFDPRDNATSRNDGMSIVVVAESGEVFVATFSPLDADDRPDDRDRWLLEPLREVPSMRHFDLLGFADDFERGYRGW